jgi:hypothetical protein
MGTFLHRDSREDFLQGVKEGAESLCCRVVMVLARPARASSKFRASYLSEDADAFGAGVVFP